MDLERKGEQSYQGQLVARFMAFGNSRLRSVYDHSLGFFRRQIILSTMPRPADRVDDPELGEKLIAEKDSIFMWCLLGLFRLMHNDFRFTISQRAMENLTKARTEDNNILSFLSSEGYIKFDYHASATSRQLYSVYRDWCEDNATRALSDRTFWSYLREHTIDLGLDYTNTIPIGNGRYARGFKGIGLCQ
jgi:putative DNA primase/helicase